MTVEIEAWAPNTDPDSSVIGTIDFYLPKMKLHLRRWRLVKGKHGVFVSSPSYKDESSDEWVRMIEFDGKLNKVLIDEILEACQPYLSDMPQEQAQPPAEGVPF